MDLVIVFSDICPLQSVILTAAKVASQYNKPSRTKFVQTVHR